MIETAMCDTVRTTPMWKKIFLSQLVLIFIFNIFTLIGIAGNRNLRKRTLFLVINLAVADLLGGVVSGPLLTFLPECNVLHYTIPRAVVGNILLSASLVSLSLI